MEKKREHRNSTIHGISDIFSCLFCFCFDIDKKWINKLFSINIVQIIQYPQVSQEILHHLENVHKSIFPAKMFNIKTFIN